jgi:hypothetical protein
VKNNWDGWIQLIKEKCAVVLVVEYEVPPIILGPLEMLR